MAHYGRKYGKSVERVSPSTMAALDGYSWPGNVRALRHAVERAVIMAEGDTLEAADFSLADSRGTAAAAVAGARDVAHTEDLHLERMEKQLIERALTKHRYNISRAAKELGITRASLYRRMEKYGL